MESMLIWVGTTIGGLLLYLLIGAMVKAPGSMLQTKFAQLTADTNGVVAGKTLEEVKKACGSPSSVSAMGNGQTLYQWQATGYHIALVFDENDVCVGISSEIKV